MSLAIAATLLGGCSMIPDYQRPEAPVENAWPEGEAYSQGAAQVNTAAADLDWQAFFQEPALRQLVQLALDNNRDLRTAALNV